MDIQELWQFIYLLIFTVGTLFVGFQLKHFIAKFHSSQVDMIVVKNEFDRENLITTINSLQQIGGCANVGTKDRLLLISKITTIDEIKKNY